VRSVLRGLRGRVGDDVASNNNSKQGGFMKKLYPWIPFLGIILTLKANPDETGISNVYVSLASAAYQAVMFYSLKCLTS
jgi:hypothetical protein